MCPEAVSRLESLPPDTVPLPSIGLFASKPSRIWREAECEIKIDSDCAEEVAVNKISLKVNGKLHTVELEPATPLLYVLSDEIGLRGPKFGCGMAQCGSCTVILRGQVVRSCVMPVSAVGQDEITTLEGLGTPEKPHPIQQAFIDEGAAQCGFCLSGVILTAKAVLDKKPNASDQEIGEALGGVLCRCFTHLRMLRAIRKYAGARKA